MATIRKKKKPARKSRAKKRKAPTAFRVNLKKLVVVLVLLFILCFSIGALVYVIFFRVVVAESGQLNTLFLAFSNALHCIGVSGIS